MIELVISGGQTGADQAAWRAAKAAGIPTGGWMPKGFKTEDGRRPEFAELYGAKEHPSPEYRDRTTSNIGLADMTFLFGNPNSAGGRLVRSIADDLPHLVLIIKNPLEYPPTWAATSVRRWGDLRRVNVAGNRESRAKGIGAWVEAYMTEVFRLLND